MNIKHFLRGVGSVFCLYPARIKLPSIRGEETDTKALQSDWQVVGKDIEAGMYSAEQEIRQK